MQNATKRRWHTRWMVRRDLEAVVAIEAASKRVPWTEEDFCKHLRKRNEIGHVAEVGDRVSGFMLYRLLSDRVVLLNIATDPKQRRKGVGSSLIRKLKEKLRSGMRTRLTADVPEGCLPLLLLLRSHGFLATRLMRGEEEDVITMEYVMQGEG